MGFKCKEMYSIRSNDLQWCLGYPGSRTPSEPCIQGPWAVLGHEGGKFFINITSSRLLDHAWGNLAVQEDITHQDHVFRTFKQYLRCLDCLGCKFPIRIQSSRPWADWVLEAPGPSKGKFLIKKTSFRCLGCPGCKSPIRITSSRPSTNFVDGTRHILLLGPDTSSCLDQTSPLAWSWHVLLIGQDMSSCLDKSSCLSCFLGLQHHCQNHLGLWKSTVQPTLLWFPHCHYQSNL